VVHPPPRYVSIYRVKRATSHTCEIFMSEICLVFLSSLTNQLDGSRVLLKKLIVTQLIMKFHAFYRTQMFIAVLMRVREFRSPV